MEFRRSTGLAAADDMLATGSWKEMYVQRLPHHVSSNKFSVFDKNDSLLSNVLSPLSSSVPTGSDLGTWPSYSLREPY